MPLTDSAIKAAKPAAKPYKLSDSQGLYLLINPNGSKLWRLKYRMAGKRNSCLSAPTPLSHSFRRADDETKPNFFCPKGKTQASSARQRE